MRAPQRRFAPAVIERLFREPYRFEYFQAVRMLELWLHRRGQRREPAVPALFGRVWIDVSPARETRGAVSG